VDDASEVPLRGSGSTRGSQQPWMFVEPEQEQPSPVVPTRWQLLFPSQPSNPGLEVLSLGEVRPLLTAFSTLEPRSGPRLRLLEVPGVEHDSQRAASGWEVRLREDFLSRFGPPLLPLPGSLASSRLFLALQLSTRYMGELDAFEAMKRADLDAIHELYLLDGTLMRRYVPASVQFP